MSAQVISNAHLYGLAQHQLVEHHGYLLQKEALEAFLQLRDHAKSDGMDIAICSAYRSFERQMAIFNAKASGERAVLDSKSQLLDVTKLNPKQQLLAILNWSALPGASRHHWGTDLDVYDASQIQGSQLKLVSDEYQGVGPCAKLAQWLNVNSQEYGFFLPYQQDLSGVNPEPWHISYAPISKMYLTDFDINTLHQIIAHSDIALKNAILDHLPPLIEEYVYRIADSDK